MFGAKCNGLFIVKCLLRDRPFFYVFCSMIAGIFVFGWILMIAESPLDRIISDNANHTYVNSAWEAICTMTTVGFGDIYP